MGLRDLGLAQPLQQRRITSGSCDCLHLGAMCVCVRHSHVRVCVRDGVFVSGMRVLFADLWGEREGFTHQHFPSRANPCGTDRLFCETPRALFGIESNSRTTRDLKNCAKAHLAACWDSDILARTSWNFKGDNRERGNCTSESPAGSDTPSTNQLTSKRSHGAWQPGRSLIANLQNLTVVLPWESTPSRQWGLENRPEDWKGMLSFAIDVSYLLLDNAT